VGHNKIEYVVTAHRQLRDSLNICNKYKLYQESITYKVNIISKIDIYDGTLG